MATNNFGKRVLVLWDGECRFCQRSVNLLLSWDKYGIITASPYQDAPVPPMTPQLAAQCEKAVHVVTENGRILRGARAVFYALRFTRFAPVAFVLTLPPLIQCAEAGYKIVASNRDFFSDLIFGKQSEGCALPPTPKSQ